MKQLTVITGNLNKVNEIVSIFGSDLSIEVKHRKIDLLEYQGDLDFIVREKCKEAAKQVDGPVVVEDTSLSLTALHGMPGPYVKWFVDPLGPMGIYRMIKDWQDKTAQAICMMAFAESKDAPIHTFKGVVNGTIVQPRGGNQFGWDPCFQPDGFQQTFGEMPVEAKNKISHRFKVTDALKEFLIKNYQTN